MSVRALSWVWEHSQAVGNSRLVLLAIADRANDDGTDAWPSQEGLVKKTRLSRRTVQRCIAELEALGELAVQRDRGAVNRYTVRMDRRTDMGVEAADQRQIDATPRQTDTGVNLSPVTPVTLPPASAVAHSTSCTSDLSPRAREADEPPQRVPHSARSPGLVNSANPFVGRFPVPRVLHQRFVGLLQGREPDPEQALYGLYFDAVYAFTEGDRRGELADPDMFKFWQARFREKWPPTPTTSGASGSHETPARAVASVDRTADRFKELTGQEAYRTS